MWSLKVVLHTALEMNSFENIGKHIQKYCGNITKIFRNCRDVETIELVEVI